jgi:hypothetical protein
MIRKSSAGYTVFARSGRKMGTYPTLARAQVRLGQLEAFKANRAPMGSMSPTVRSKSKDGRKGYYVRAKSGRSMGWYPTKREAEMRKGQLEANGAKFFKETRGYTRKVGSPRAARLGYRRARSPGVRPAKQKTYRGYVIKIYKDGTWCEGNVYDKRGYIAQSLGAGTCGPGVLNAMILRGVRSIDAMHGD